MSKHVPNQLYRLILSHFLEMVREPGVLFWGIVFPILMAWGLGIAFTKQNDLTRKVAWVQATPSAIRQDTSDLSIFLKQHATKENGDYIFQLDNKNLGNFSIVVVVTTWDEAYTLLKKGNISLILEDQATRLLYHFDPANSEAVNLYQQLHSVVAEGFEVVSIQEQEIKPLTIAGTRYIDFLVPGLIAMGIMMSSMWGISYTLIDRRSKKLLRRMVATPMKKSNFLIALVAVRFTMNLAEGGLLFLFAWIYFGVHVQGSLVALVLVFLAGNIAFSGISVLISSHTSNPEVGNGFINAITTPMMVISGVFFSYHNFPDWSIAFIQHMPLTLLADSMRSIFNESIHIADVWKETLILSSIGVVCFLIGLKIFKWY